MNSYAVNKYRGHLGERNLGIEKRTQGRQAFYWRNSNALLKNLGMIHDVEYEKI